MNAIEKLKQKFATSMQIIRESDKIIIANETQLKIAYKILNKNVLV